MEAFHKPVMVQECLTYLSGRPDGVIVDATVGGGGHSLAILSALPGVRMLCFDQDPEALDTAGKALSAYQDRVELIRSNFSGLRTCLSLRRIKQVSGILFDLGVSSHQLDAADRGFSFDQSARLDMRMDPDAARDAHTVVNELPERELAHIFKEYGEELLAGKIARAIVKRRAEKPIDTTGELARIVDGVTGAGSREALKSKARVFQALRIYVNRELEVLQTALTDAINILEPGGRIVVLSYHSLEDRIVKNTFRQAAAGCVCPPKAMDCICGKVSKLKVLTGRPIMADAAETESNSRARSAKLRAGEKKQGDQ